MRTPAARALAAAVVALVLAGGSAGKPGEKVRVMREGERRRLGRCRFLFRRSSARRPLHLPPPRPLLARVAPRGANDQQQGERFHQPTTLVRTQDWIDSPFIGSGSPPANTNTTIYFSAYLDRLISVDEQEYQFKASFFFLLNWIDEGAADAVAKATEDANKPGGDCARWCDNTVIPSDGSLCCDGLFVPSLIIRNVFEYPQGVRGEGSGGAKRGGRVSFFLHPTCCQHPFFFLFLRPTPTHHHRCQRLRRLLLRAVPRRHGDVPRHDVLPLGLADAGLPLHHQLPRQRERGGGRERRAERDGTAPVYDGEMDKKKNARSRLFVWRPPLTPVPPLVDPPSPCIIQGAGDDASGWRAKDLDVWVSREPYYRQFNDPLLRNNVNPSHPDDPAPLVPAPGSDAAPFGSGDNGIVVTSITMALVIKRLSLFFLISIILPVVVCTGISFLTFFVDPDRIDTRLQVRGRGGWGGRNKTSRAHAR